jgi:RNase P/RNase MRP subunit POP5
MARRYLLVKVVSDRPLSSDQFAAALIGSVRRCFGEIGLSRIDPRLVRFNPNRSEAIVACKKDRASELQAAIALTSEASEVSIAPLVLRVSGTIKGLGKRKLR